MGNTLRIGFLGAGKMASALAGSLLILGMSACYDSSNPSGATVLSVTETNDIADATGNGEVVGQESAAVEDEKIDAHEARDVKRDEGAEVEGIDPCADGGEAEIGGEEERGESEDQGGDREWRQALEEELPADQEGGAKPEPEDQADDKGGGHVGGEESGARGHRRVRSGE